MLGQPAAATSPFASWRSSASGTANWAVPQSKQTTSSGNTHTTGLSMFFSPGKWMAISAVNLLWLTDPHDLHGMPVPQSALTFWVDAHGENRHRIIEEFFNSQRQFPLEQ